jgi:hypothetical protein
MRIVPQEPRAPGNPTQTDAFARPALDSYHDSRADPTLSVAWPAGGAARMPLRYHVMGPSSVEHLAAET